MAGGATDLGREAETLKSTSTSKSSEHGTRPATTDKSAARRGVALDRFFTTAGVDPYSEVDWDFRSAIISGEDGRIVFEQKDVEVPRPWSQTATNVVVSNYF